MDRDWLAGELSAGRSIESLARELGKHPSTVAYWANKHGLVSSHAERHTSAGGIARGVLEPLVEANLSSRQIAARLGLSQTAVRYWLDKYELQTARAKRRRQIAASMTIEGEVAFAECEIHGYTQFCPRSGGGWRCTKCRSASVVERRRKVKEILVAEAGGSCVICGYAKSPGALHFHHLDPSEKAFSLSRQGMTMSLDSARAEATKCVLLCANCHVEVEAGIATLPS